MKTRSNGQLAVRVFPAETWDKIFYQGFTADIMKPRSPDAPPELTEYPDVVPSPRDESYVLHYTFNKWQLDKKKFENDTEDQVIKWNVCI